MTRVSTCLWFDERAEEAATFWVETLNAAGHEARITSTNRYPRDAAGNKAGAVMTVHLTLDGHELMLLNGGPHYQHSPAASLFVLCRDQGEVDQLWSALTEGGKEIQCGWLTDRYGISWQIVPEGLMALMSGPNAAKAMTAFVSMKKLDIHAIERAVAG